MNRTVVLGAAWSASAVAAVGLGFLAVSLVDASASPGSSPVAATSTASTTPGAPSTPSTPLLATGEHATVAGTVYADCTSSSPVLAGAPAAGWWVDDSNKPGQVEFQNAGQKLEVYVSCVNGSPYFVVEGPRADDNSRGSHSSSSSASSASASHSSGHDDSSGRGGGNSGHGGSGSGSDDD